MTKKIFILVPSDSATGPIKGAYALANALAGRREVTLVSLKKGTGAHADLDERVKRICLADSEAGFGGRLRLYRRLLAAAGGRQGAASISMCLSADAFNLLCSRQAVICSSIRGNLVGAYRMSYGRIGVLVAAIHLAALRYFDCVGAMTEAMAKQIASFSGKQPAVIGNFVDEALLAPFVTDRQKEGAWRFAFVGSLTVLKQPGLIVAALAELKALGHEVRGDFLGDGPLRETLHDEIVRHGLSDLISLHGFLSSPYEPLAQADVMVLPSLSEGVPRAALEALYLGVPCVLRDADGNAEFIAENVNGALFSRDEDLAAAMLRAARISRQSAGARPANLLPEKFRQDKAAGMYLDLVEAVN